MTNQRLVKIRWMAVGGIVLVGMLLGLLMPGASALADDSGLRQAELSITGMT